MNLCKKKVRVIDQGFSMKKIILFSLSLLVYSLHADMDDDIKRNTKELIADLEKVGERIEDAAERLKERVEQLGETLKERAKKAGATITKGVQSLERNITDYVD